MLGVTLGYLSAGGVAAAVFLNLGWLVLPVLPLPLLWHGVRGATMRAELPRSHERALFGCHVWMLALLGLLYALPIGWGYSALDPESELAALLGSRDIEAILQWLELWLKDQADSPAFAFNLASGFAWFAAHAALSAVVGIFLMVKVLRRFLRWSDRLPA